MDLLHLLENTFDRKRISANPSPNPNRSAKFFARLHIDRSPMYGTF